MSIDENLISTMNMFFIAAKQLNGHLTDDQLRLKVLAANLKGLAGVFIHAAEHDIPVDPQQTALGLLGSAAWAEEGLPE